MIKKGKRRQNVTTLEMTGVLKQPESLPTAEN
jgi:hypothetical protein